MIYYICLNANHIDMKKYLILIITVALFACSKEDDKGKLDPNAMVSIRADLTATSLTKAGHLSNLEIVRQTAIMSFYNEELTGGSISRGFSDAQKDEVNLRLLMWGTDIIDQDGNYVTEFINGRDFVISRNLSPSGTTPVFDTIAYIPQSVIVAARNHIRTAYDQSDFRTVYDLFDNAFTFRATTGAEWRALKAQGNN